MKDFRQSMILGLWQITQIHSLERLVADHANYFTFGFKPVA